jgi:hypothetical protein
MSLTIGNQTATTGMSKDIYDKLREALEEGLPPEIGEDDLDAMRESWQKIAFAVATGVIEHIKANMEIRGVQAQGDVIASINGNTGTANPDNHSHSVNLSINATGVTFSQSNDGTGLVE